MEELSLICFQILLSLFSKTLNPRRQKTICFFFLTLKIPMRKMMKIRLIQNVHYDEVKIVDADADKMQTNFLNLI